MVFKYFYKCNFAHGENELRTKIHISLNYRSKPCKQFNEQNFCSYGIRCQYMHIFRSYVDSLNCLLDKIGVWTESKSSLDMKQILDENYRMNPRLRCFQNILTTITN